MQGTAAVVAVEVKAAEWVKNFGDGGNGNGGAGDEGCAGDGVKVERAPAVVMLSMHVQPPDMH